MIKNIIKVYESDKWKIPLTWRCTQYTGMWRSRNLTTSLSCPLSDRAGRCNCWRSTVHRERSRWKTEEKKITYVKESVVLPDVCGLNLAVTEKHLCDSVYLPRLQGLSLEQLGPQPPCLCRSLWHLGYNCDSSVLHCREDRKEERRNSLR